MKYANRSIFAAGLLISSGSIFASTNELPANARPGECYAQSITAPIYDTVTEQQLKKEASERIEIIPAQYSWAEQIYLTEDVVHNGKVVVAAGTSLSANELAALKRDMAGSAGYTNGSTNSTSGSLLMTERTEVVPAKYDWVSENVLVTPARTEWSKGRGMIEKVDDTTGEIMCLIEKPAVYNTVRKRVQTSPATTRTIQVPVKYTMVRVNKLTSAPQERRIKIPAKYETISKRTLISDSRVEWKQILCQTNMSASKVKQLQNSLNSAGFNVGSVDGVVGRSTMSAFASYQRSKGFSSDDISERLSSLGIRD